MGGDRCRLATDAGGVSPPRALAILDWYDGKVSTRVAATTARRSRDAAATRYAARGGQSMRRRFAVASCLSFALAAQEAPKVVSLAPALQDCSVDSKT